MFVCMEACTRVSVGMFVFVTIYMKRNCYEKKCNVNEGLLVNWAYIFDTNFAKKGIFY